MEIVLLSVARILQNLVSLFDPPGGASGDTRHGSCRHCGRRNHSSGDCHYKDAECHNCGKRGHIAPICRGKEESKHKPDKSKKKFS